VEGRQEDGRVETAKTFVPVLRETVFRRSRPSLLGAHEHASGGDME